MKFKGLLAILLTMVMAGSVWGQGGYLLQFGGGGGATQGLGLHG